MKKKYKKIGKPVSFFKPKVVKLKKSKTKINKVKLLSLKFPPYLTSHSKPQNVRKYIASKERLARMDKFSFNAWGKPKELPKKDMTWPQAKVRFPKLKPMKDTDKDGVINLLDCRPFNKKKQGFEHQYSFSSVASKRIKTVKMPPRKFLEETYKEVKQRQEASREREIKAGKKLYLPTKTYGSYEEYEKKVIDPRSVEYQKERIQSKERDVPIGFLTYEEGKPVSHEGRHAAKAAEELEMETIPVTVESYKEEEVPEVEKLEPYEEQYGDYDLKDEDDKTLDFDEEAEEKEEEEEEGGKNENK